MSLFPAYSGSAENSEKGENSNADWLQNSSFSVNFPTKTHENRAKSSSESELEAEPPKIDKLKVKKRKIAVENDEHFHIDKSPTREFLSVKTISRPSVSKYKIAYHIRSEKHYRSFKKFRRYYRKIVQTEEVNSDITCMKTDQNLLETKTTLNKKVRDDPKNVDLWLEFINFQDDLFKSEKITKKGSIAKSLRAKAECKLSILEKALKHNPNCEKLHRKRLEIFQSVYPADELQKTLQKLIEKDQDNIVLWQGYIESTQCSMSHCNTDSVLKLYINCLSTLHKIRRNNTGSANRIYEENILRIIYQCGLFLRQSGLFEQLWTLLKMYLEMNLGDFTKDSFAIHVEVNEKQLRELEDLVFKSQLPSHELWLRTEKLRELCHFQPISEAESNCEDPQRIVFQEDVVELIQPITMPENTFRLTATILHLLKVPLLPCRHRTIQELNLDYVPWSLDSIESILPVHFDTRIHTIKLDLGPFFIDFQPNVGPQYLKTLPGQEEYLNFVLKTMKKCIDYLKGDDKVSLIIWWIRFQRLLIILENEGKFTSPQNFKKTVKNNIKSILKDAEHRNNTLFYVEYALLENELGSDSMNILKMAYDSNISRKIDENSTHIARSLAETLISSNENEKSIEFLINFVLETKDVQVCEVKIDEAILKFKHLILKNLNENLNENGNYIYTSSVVMHFKPIFICDLTICAGWLIYLSKGPFDCGTFLEEIIEKVEENTLENEILHEFYVAIMYKFCSENPGYGLFKALDQILHRSLRLFPNNLFFLGILAKESFILNSLGPKWWTTKTILMKSGHALPILMLIYITYQIILNLQDQFVDTITGAKFDLNGPNFKNIMLSLFKTATTSSMCTRQCGLIWRLYLQFVHKYFDSKLCRKIYYCAVEEIPWLKALYIDAAIYIPAELGQIQDLIIEKQLRIHITPEELEVLRE